MITSELRRLCCAALGCAALLSVVPGSPAVAQEPPVRFEDVSSLITFEHRSREFGGLGFSGAAFFDLDNDGWIDLLLPNGRTQNNRLFRNNADGTFTDIAEQAGVANGLGNSGAYAVDLDNDGFKEIFLTTDDLQDDSPAKLYYNNGDSTFTDISDNANITAGITTASAAFADINNDGYLDLFLGAAHRDADFARFPNQLFLNNGDLTFTDISAAAGIDTDLGACIALFSDYNNDGWIDLFVGNCSSPVSWTRPIELYQNNGDSTFTERSEEAGMNSGGFPMGFGPADFDNDGDVDIFTTDVGTAGPPIFNELALYSSNCDGTYTDLAPRLGISLREWGWGCAATDFDNDGWADIFFAGSYPPFPFSVIGRGKASPGVLWINRGGNELIEYTSTLPQRLDELFTSGVAHGDYDNDGFMDLVIVKETYEDDPGHPILWRNLGNGNNWVKVKLEGTTSNRDAVGARVEIDAGSLQQTKEVYAGSSFLSMDSQWLVFGIGRAPATERVMVRWPTGELETFENITAGDTARLVEGQGTPGDTLAARSLCLGVVPASSADPGVCGSTPAAGLALIVSLGLLRGRRRR